MLNSWHLTVGKSGGVSGVWPDCAKHAGRKSLGVCPNCGLHLCDECLGEHYKLRHVEGDCHA